MNASADVRRAAAALILGRTAGAAVNALDAAGLLVDDLPPREDATPASMPPPDPYGTEPMPL